MSAQKLIRSADPDNPDREAGNPTATLGSGTPLPATAESDLDELRRYLRTAPSKSAILIASVSALLMAIFATIATAIAVRACLGG